MSIKSLEMAYKTTTDLTFAMEQLVKYKKIHRFEFIENYFEGLKFDLSLYSQKSDHFSQILHYEFSTPLLLSLPFFCNYSISPNIMLLVELLTKSKKCLRNLIQM